MKCKIFSIEVVEDMSEISSLLGVGQGVVADLGSRRTQPVGTEPREPSLLSSRPRLFLLSYTLLMLSASSNPNDST